MINFTFFIFFNKISILLNIFDIPDEDRKFHQKKVAPIGGVLFFINLIFLLFYLTFGGDFFDASKTKFLNGNKQYFSFFLIASLIFLMGILDDKINLSASKKSFFLIIAIVLSLVDKNIIIEYLNFEFISYHVSLDHFGVFFSILAIFYFINALNMFDGINIQTPLYLLLIFSFLIYKFQIIVIFLLIPSIFFLILNLLGKCFLGNSGSYMLGYLISLILIKVNQANPNIITSEEILIILSLPSFELFRLFIERILKDKSPFSGDRNHIHHYLNKRFSILMTSLITNGFIFIPLIVSQFLEIKIIIFILQLILYFFLIYKLKKI